MLIYYSITKFGVVRPHLTQRAPDAGMASANALALGDPAKLDERCSLEARSPDLRTSQAVFYA